MPMARNIKRRPRFAMGCDCSRRQPSERERLYESREVYRHGRPPGTVSVAVMDAGGKLIMEYLLKTKASTIVAFIQGLQGTLSLTFEEGTSAAWLHDLLKPHVSRLVVCDPRKAARLKDGNKRDRIDARKLAELLRTNQLKAVYHGKHGARTLKELGRSYLTMTKDVTRGALYRSWAIPCSGSSV